MLRRLCVALVSVMRQLVYRTSWLDDGLHVFALHCWSVLCCCNINLEVLECEWRVGMIRHLCVAMESVVRQLVYRTS
jgi:hypothetical protein